MPWVGLQFVIVVFPDHTHLHFDFRYFMHSGVVEKMNIINSNLVTPG